MAFIAYIMIAIFAKNTKSLAKSMLPAGLLGFILALPLNLPAQPATGREIRKEMEDLLEELAVYDFDKSRTWMPGLQTLMKSVYNNPEVIVEIEPLMIDFLGSEATVEGKQMVCRELGTIGTARSVPALSELMETPGMEGSVLLALEKIPGKEADQALLKMLDGNNEERLIAVINSLAARRVTDAVVPLAEYMHKEKKMLALTAIAALGSIGVPEAAEFLATLPTGAGPRIKEAAQDALLKCADGMRENGETENAYLIYAQVYRENPAKTLKYHALLGKFLNSTEDPYAFVLRHLQQEEPDFHPYIVNLVYRLDSSHGLGRIFEDLQGQPHVPGSHLIEALAAIGDPSLRPVVVKRLANPEPGEDRMAAMRALPRIGLPQDAILLAGLAASGKGKERELARQSLYLLPGPETDETILRGIRDETGSTRAELVRSTGERNMRDATRILFELTSDPDRKIRTESIRALGKLAHPESLPELVEVLVRSPNPRERQEAVRAVYAVTQKMAENVDRSAVIVSALEKSADPAIQASLVGIIGMIADGKDLGILRFYLESGEQEVELAVIRALSGWPDAAPMEDLKRLVSSTDDQLRHTLALRGYVDVVLADPQMNREKKMIEIRNAYGLCNTQAESRIVISGLSRIRSLDALEMAIGLLDDPDLKKEAEAAVARIAEQTGWEYPQETTAQLEPVLQKIENEDVKNRILGILDRIK